MELAGNWQVVALTALVMALGTYTGGGRIIRKVGRKWSGWITKSALYPDLAGSIQPAFDHPVGFRSPPPTPRLPQCWGWVAKPPTGGCLARWSLPGCSPSPRLWGVGVFLHAVVPYPCCRVPFYPDCDRMKENSRNSNKTRRNGIMSEIVVRDIQWGTKEYEDELALRNEILRVPLGLNLYKQGSLPGEHLLACGSL